MTFDLHETILSPLPHFTPVRQFGDTQSDVVRSGWSTQKSIESIQP